MAPAATGPTDVRLLYAEELNGWGGAPLERFLADARSGRIALVSSFGAESAVLIHLCVSVRPDLPVIFIDTRKHFSQTIAYRDLLVDRLGLRDLRVISADMAEVDDHQLWRRDPGACCDRRKVVPLQRALGDFDSWISGRKAFQGGERAALRFAEMQDGRLKVNPLFDWSKPEIEAYFARHDLPPHPLAGRGFPSIGCINCTRPASDGESRAGRWHGTSRTECGIHISATGSLSRERPHH